MAVAARPVLLGMIVAYLGVLLGRRFGGVPEPIDWYLADLVCLPLVLGLILMAQRMTGKPEVWILPRWHGVFGFTFFALYFELVLPHLSPRAIGDGRDILAYFLGWLLFELLINRPHQKSRDPKTAAFLSI